MEKNAFTRWGFRACMGCGDTIHPDREHECDPLRAIDWQVNTSLVEIERIDEALAAYLATPQGAFENYYAARQRNLQ